MLRWRRGTGETGRRQHDGDLARLGKLGPGGLQATEDAVAPAHRDCTQALPRPLDMMLAPALYP